MEEFVEKLKKVILLDKKKNMKSMEEKKRLMWKN